MPYRIAGIDVHKKMLAVVVSDVEIDSEYQFERKRFSSNPEQLRSLAAWLLEQAVEEVVMESTAQYWKPAWEALERYWKPTCEKREGVRRKSGTLHLAQALSNRGSDVALYQDIAETPTGCLCGRKCPSFLRNWDNPTLEALRSG